MHAPIPAGHTFRDVWYEEKGQVGYLHFDFYNGAMSTEQCRRLRDAYRYAKARTQTKVIVLMGGEDFFSNGIHLNVIEAAENQGEECYYNLHAIDDIVQDILETESHIVVSALQGDAAAGGVPFAVAADHVVAREDVVFNPYYQHMGGLYGSEYWTYVLPRRVGAEMTEELTSAPFNPIGTRRAKEIGLIDDVFGADLAELPHAPDRPGRAPRPSRRPAGLAGGEEPPPRRRRGRQADRRVPRRGDGEVARVLLRARPQLSRGAPRLRVEDRRALRGAGRGQARARLRRQHGPGARAGRRAHAASGAGRGARAPAPAEAPAEIGWRLVSAS